MVAESGKVGPEEMSQIMDGKLNKRIQKLPEIKGALPQHIQEEKEAAMEMIDKESQLNMARLEELQDKLEEKEELLRSI